MRDAEHDASVDFATFAEPDLRELSDFVDRREVRRLCAVVGDHPRVDRSDLLGAGGITFERLIAVQGVALVQSRRPARPRRCGAATGVPAQDRAAG